MLGRIRAAEAQRQELEQDAQKRKERMLREVQLEARHILEQAASEAEASAGELVRTETERIRQERERVVQDGEREVARQREGSSARLPEAVNTIYEEFVRQLNAQTP